MLTCCKEVFGDPILVQFKFAYGFMYSLDFSKRVSGMFMNLVSLADIWSAGSKVSPLRAAL